MVYAVVRVPNADGPGAWRVVPVDDAQGKAMTERGAYVTKLVRQAHAVAKCKNKSDEKEE